MKSKIKLGDLAVKKAVDDLVAEGYICETPVKSQWQRQDFFNCWDIIAVAKNGKFPAPLIRFIQVSSKRLSQRGIEYNQKLNAFPSGTFWTREFWWYKEGGWVKTIL